MLCPKCGAQLSDSAVICRACGAMLPEQPAVPRTCAQCGAPLESGVRFCTNCGAPVPEPSAPPQQGAAPGVCTGAAAPFIPGICPRCGSRLVPGSRFCTVCGMPAPEVPQDQGNWYAPAPGGTASSPEIGPKHNPKKLLIGLLCGFAALVVIAAVLIGLFAARGGSHGTTGNTEVDQLIERYFTYFENDDISGMNKIFLPEAVAFMRDDEDGLLTVEEAIEELDDWYDDYGRTIDDYDIYDSDQLDKEDLTQLEWALDVRIDDNLVVACNVTYASGADEDFYFEFVQVSGQWYLLFAMD